MRRKEVEVRKRIDRALKRADSTKYVEISEGANASISKCLNQFFKSNPALIIADKNTYEVAGKEVFERLRSSDCQVLEPLIFKEDNFFAEMEYVEKLGNWLQGKSVTPIAVGSGTINDIVKLASGRLGIPYLAVSTAASMDGYTAFGASISYKGAKQTFDCKAPLAVIADVNIISKAPLEMNAAGYADLIAKIPSGADWLVADALGLEPIDPISWELTQIHIHEMVSNPSGVKAGDKDTLLGVMEGLIMTGLGMQVYKTSRPASGAEHQFSHLWDNQHHTYNGSAPSHGFKVGIGSMASEALYEQIIQTGIPDIKAKIDTIDKWWPSFNGIENEIHKHFPNEELAEQAIAQCKAKYKSSSEISKRLLLLESIWLDLTTTLNSQLLGTKKMQQMLNEAGAPFMPEQIGITKERLFLSYTQAQLIRKRYTVLDLVFETNTWEDNVIQLFKNDGFWAK